MQQIEAMRERKKVLGKGLDIRQLAMLRRSDAGFCEVRLLIMRPGL
ncbi:hypothetical protein [Dyella sp. C11]|nr:hypothetical protein [Dyella sp. C11]